jgi:hypothetical protein
MVEQEQTKFLINKKIKVTPIVRDNNGFLPKGHDGEFMYTGAEMSFCVPIDSKRKQLVHIFDGNEDIRIALEKKLQLKEGTMSFYDRENPYWTKYRVKLNKDDCILKANPKEIAINWDNRNFPTCRFALVDEDEKIKKEANKAEITKNAWLHYSKIENDVDKMQGILRIYGKKTNSDKVEFLRGEISKLIEDSASKFLETVEDKDLNMKIFINKCINIRALELNVKGEYSLFGGELIGKTLVETIQYLNDPKNQDILLKLKKQVDK